MILQATEGKNNVNSLVKIMTNVVEKGGFKALWGGKGHCCEDDN